MRIEGGIGHVKFDGDGLSLVREQSTTDGRRLGRKCSFMCKDGRGRWQEEERKG